MTQTSATPTRSAPPAGDALLVENLSFTYPGGVRALQDLTLSIPRGSKVGVVGPSGCGKSTLLQVLAGIGQPSSGRVTFPATPPGVHDKIMVFQADTLLPWLTVSQNVSLYFRFHRAPKAQVRKRVAELLAMVGLSDFADAFPYQLSGGMRRRVAFLAAVAPKPAMLLLDEPFSALDEPTRVAIHGDVLRIVQELDTTVVLVTHDLAEAITLCDEVYILTNRPGTVASRKVIPQFDSDQSVLDLRHSPEFLTLYGELWNELSNQISSEGRR